MQGSPLKTYLGTKATLATALLATAILVAPEIQAQVWNNTSGGASCRASSGAAASSFYFNNSFVQNIGTRSQYITCDLPYFSIGPTAWYAVPPLQLSVVLANPIPDTTVTFVCVVQAGYYPVEVNSSVFVTDVRGCPGCSADLVREARSAPALPLPPNRYSPYSLFCLVPPQGKLGLIHVRLAEALSTP